MSEHDDLTTTLTALADTAARSADMRPGQAIRRRARQRAARQRAMVTAAAAVVVAAVALTATGIREHRAQPVVLPTSNGFPTSMWLPADKYPLADTYHWRAQDPIDATAETTTFPCQDHTWQSLGSRSSQESNLVPSPTPGYAAAQKVVRFANAATARRAYNALESDIQTCHAVQGAGQGPGDAAVTVTRTAGLTTATSWKITTAQPLDAFPLESHVMLLQRGPVVTTVVLQWNGNTHPTSYPAELDNYALEQLAARYQ